MKKFIIFIMLFAGFVFGQVTITTQSGRITPPKPTDKTPPLITLNEPAIDNTNTFTSKAKLLMVSGLISDNSKVTSCSVNDRDIQLDASNSFHAEIELQPGENRVIIKAADENKNTSELNFTVAFQLDESAPVITITEPQIIEGQELVVLQPYITIRGKAIDENGVQNVFVDGVRATFQSRTDFFVNVNLKDSSNTLIIKATDSTGNTSEKTLSITYKSDINGPVISIIEPAVTRGSTVISKKEVQTIKGIAVDQSGVLDVTVNNRKTVLNSNGEFTIDLYLTVGDNQIIVSATDTKMNVSVDTFTIARKLEELITGGKYYALIVGIDEYNGAWTPLKNAVNDAKAVEDLLSSEYNFDEIIPLYNEEATRKNIIQKFEQLAAKVTKDDNVLIFYSGHGEFKQQLNKGYWVPVDAASRSTADFISNSDIQTYLNGIRSKHTLLVADACFSGDIFRGRTDELPFEESEKYFKEVYKRVSRAALTSGGIEPVTDGGREGHSVFTYYLLKALKENNSKYFTAGQVFNAINIPVTNNSEQTPVFQPIKNTGDEGGQFIFIKR